MTRKIALCVVAFMAPFLLITFRPNWSTETSLMTFQTAMTTVVPTTELPTTTTEPVTIPSTIPETTPEPESSPTNNENNGGETMSSTALDTDIAGCIRKYESGGTTDTGGNYSEPGGGAYQIIHSTWAGYGGYSNAEDAPGSVQDAKFEQLWAEAGHHHWAAQAGRCF